MAVHIRLARYGTSKLPFYRIVVADQRCPRDGRFIERLGSFDPRIEELRLNQDRLQFWLDRGAQASHTVKKLVKSARKAAAAAQA